MMTVLVLGVSWLLVSALNGRTNTVAQEREHNARVLQQAKATLIGYVAQQAADSNEDDPGRLPCPDTTGNGIAASSCTLPAVGRLPWRTLGLDHPSDASGGVLWYVVSSGWALPYSSATLDINSNTPGQLQVDGNANAAIALIIAAGPPLDIAPTAAQAAAGCAAHTQIRGAATFNNAADYLECDNANGDSSFVTSVTGNADNTVFNDQVVQVTTSDLLPQLEAAIVDRFERQIAPALRTVYSGVNPGDPWPSTPVLPFAAPFGNPATSSLEGSLGRYQGLLPLSHAETSPGSGTLCSIGSDPRCDPTFVAWTGIPSLTGPSVYSSNCTRTSTQIGCTFYYWYPLLWSPPPNVSFTLTATASNVGMALRQFNTSANMPGVNSASRSAGGSLNTDGSATITLNASSSTSSGTLLSNFLSNLICGIGGILQTSYGCEKFTISVPITLLADHPVLDPNNSTYSWFIRNHWYEVSYYAVAPNIAPDGTRSCVSPPATPSCLSVDYLASSGKQRGLIVIAGPRLSLVGQSRPPVNVSDWLEGANSTGGTVFTLRDPALIANRTFNDHVAVIDANP